MPTLDESYGVLVSPNWPNEYPTEQNCHYKIRLSSALEIRFRVNFFETELDNDYLSFFQATDNRNLVKTLTGDVKSGEVFEVPGPNANVQFFSDMDGQYCGFSITYEAVSRH